MKTLDSYSPSTQWKTLEDSFNQDSGSQDTLSLSEGQELLLCCASSPIFIAEKDTTPNANDFGIPLQAGQSVYYTVSSNPLYVKGSSANATLTIHLN